MSTPRKAEDVIWVALDVPSKPEAIEMLHLLESIGVKNIKIGLEVINAEWRDEIIHLAQILGFDIFYDGKFHDIPNTIMRAVSQIARRNVAMFNLHALCGRKAMEVAVANKRESKVLAVTLLTSLGQEDLIDFGYPVQTAVPALVRRLTETAVRAGVDGVVGSAQEASTIASVFRSFGKQGLIVTPAIRPIWAAVGDQKRPTTPTDAIRAGATDLVIGRPITNPPKEIGTPADAWKLIVEETQTALEQLARTQTY